MPVRNKTQKKEKLAFTYYTDQKAKDLAPSFLKVDSKGGKGGF
jgi:hypothetical protein